MFEIVSKALGETLIMVFFSTIFSVILGFVIAIILTVTAPNGLKENKIIYKIIRCNNKYFKRISICNINGIYDSIYKSISWNIYRNNRCNCTINNSSSTICS